MLIPNPYVSSRSTGMFDNKTPKTLRGTLTKKLRALFISKCLLDVATSWNSSNSKQGYKVMMLIKKFAYKHFGLAVHFKPLQWSRKENFPKLS